MSKFLIGDDLTQAIREVVGGGTVKCAVAFWGNHRFEIANAPTEDWQIICDIHMGSTSPEALIELGAPTNAKLKHVRNIHSKVYISDKGVVIGSANASAGGLGFDGRPARLLEAGTFHESDSQIWRQASKWFDETFASNLTRQVDAAALQEAGSRYRPPMIVDEQNLADMSILRQIAAAPQHFDQSNVGFVICNRATTTEERDKAAQSAIKSKNVPGMDLNTLRRWPRTRTFVDWGDLNNLSDRFVEFFIGPRTLRKVAHHQVVGRYEEGQFYTQQPQQTITLGNQKRFPAIITSEDWLVLKDLPNYAPERLASGTGIFRASEFSEILRRVYADLR